MDIACIRNIHVGPLPTLAGATPSYQYRTHPPIDTTIVNHNGDYIHLVPRYRLRRHA